MEILQTLFEKSQWPFASAFLLGLMTAISPCPLATNITAIAYISKEIRDRKQVFVNGLIYTLGRAISYTLLGIILFLGASQFKIARFFHGWGEKLLGPLLIIIGLFMLDVIRINFPVIMKISERLERKALTGFWGVLLLGIVFALAFCPYSGVLYFGMLIPMTISQVQGLYLPLIFAFGTGLPVIFFAWLIAFTVSGVGNLYRKIKTFELWFRRTAAIIFLGSGLYFLIIFFF